MELCWKSHPIPAVRARVRAAKLLSSSREERQSVLVRDFSSEQNEVGTLQLLPYCIWWSSCLDDPLTLTAQRKETWGLVPQWEGIQGIWSWASHPGSLLFVPGRYFALSCWCSAAVQGSRLYKAGERPASCLTETLDEKTKTQNNPESRDQKPYLFKANRFSNCQKWFTFLK